MHRNRQAPKKRSEDKRIGGLQRWEQRLLACRPDPGDPRVRRPRPACFWPVDALELAAGLAGV